MMTNNRPPEDWGKLIGDVPAATAIFDRWLANAEILQITGKSYRMRGDPSTKDAAKTSPTTCGRCPALRESRVGR